MVMLTSPTRERDRQAYLAEIGKFKDMVKDCDQDRIPNSGGRSGDNEVTVQEGIECLQKFVSFFNRYNYSNARVMKSASVEITLNQNK